MILEIYQKDKSIPNVYHILKFEPSILDIWFTIKETHEKKKFKLEGIQSYCVHNDNYTKVIFTSLSLIPLSESINKLKEVMNGE